MHNQPLRYGAARTIELAQQAHQNGLVSERFVDRVSDGVVSEQDVRAALDVYERHGRSGLGSWLGMLSHAVGGPGMSAPHAGLAEDLKDAVTTQAEQQGTLRTWGESLKDHLRRFVWPFG